MSSSEKMIAAAWQTWHSRHGGKLGPGPAFREAIEAAIAIHALDAHHERNKLIGFMEREIQKVEHAYAEQVEKCAKLEARNAELEIRLMGPA